MSSSISAAPACLLLMNKKHELEEYKVNIKEGEAELKKKMDKMSDMRLSYIGWRNKVRKLFLMKLLTEDDAHEIFMHPSDISDTMGGYCGLSDDVRYLKKITSDPKNVARGYYIRIA